MEPLNARDFINPNFMGLSSQEIAELEKEAEKLQQEASFQLDRAVWTRNTRPYEADVVAQVDGEEEPRGGGSE